MREGRNSWTDAVEKFKILAQVFRRPRDFGVLAHVFRGPKVLWALAHVFSRLKVLDLGSCF